MTNHMAKELILGPMERNTLGNGKMIRAWPRNLYILHGNKYVGRSKTAKNMAKVHLLGQMETDT